MRNAKQVLLCLPIPHALLLFLIIYKLEGASAEQAVARKAKEGGGGIIKKKCKAGLDPCGSRLGLLCFLTLLLRTLPSLALAIGRGREQAFCYFTNYILLETARAKGFA
jgi:hypothetical protein